MSAIVLNTAGSAFPVDAITKQVESVSLKETGYGSRRKAVFVFKDCILPLHDDAAVGGEICNKLFDFPAEVVNLESFRVNLSIERASGTTTSLSDTFDGDFGLGTALGSGATPLTSTEQDLIANQSIPQAVAGKATEVFSSVTPVLVDATAGKSGFLNILVDDADQDGSTVPATVKLNGTIVVHYSVLGK